jgi:pyruvate/2-oxoglutarate dehydrogenase complex dihydrolipoamide acyltransferase (E2) component
LPTNKLQPFSDRDREKFRKLLEVANSTDYEGEKEAAMAAAKRMASANGMTLHEAAGASETRHIEKEKRQRKREEQNAESFKKRNKEIFKKYKDESERVAAEKHQHEEALKEAVARGLKKDEKKPTNARAKSRRRTSSRSKRSTPDFIRVLLKETKMSVNDIAATVGVTSNDVFKEKLLMRSEQSNS